MKLIAAIFDLELSADRDAPGTEAIRKWWLEGLKSYSTALFEVATNPQAANRRTPFTLSGVLFEKSRYYIRATTLTTEMSEFLLEQVERTDSIAGVDVVSTTTDANVHAGAGNISMDQLLVNTAKEHARTRIHLHFHSPTVFRRYGSYYPLPEPSLMFSSLEETWNSFSGEPFPVDMELFYQRNILLTRHRLQTRYLKLHNYVPGFMGYVRLRLRQLDDDPDWYFKAQLVRVLSDYAHFAGIGAKTSYGMGQVRVEKYLKQQPTSQLEEHHA